MKTYLIPSGAEVKRLLRGFEYRHILALSRLSTVPVSTLCTIRDHKRDPNVGIDTVRKFLSHVEKAARA